jgi:hypothetical protein
MLLVFSVDRTRFIAHRARSCSNQKEKRRLGNFARCDERPPFRRRLATSFLKKA